MPGAVVSLIVFAIGAILRFATNVQSTAWNVHTVGDILMVVGVVGFILAVVSFAYWDGLGAGGFTRRRRTTVVDDRMVPIHGRDGYARTTYDPTLVDRPVATVGRAGPAGTVVEEERSVF